MQDDTARGGELSPPDDWDDDAWHDHGVTAEDEAFWTDQLRRLDIAERPPPQRIDAGVNGHKPESEVERSTWWPLPNVELATDLTPPAPPSIVRRDDGLGLFYPGSINGVHGESGDGKSWLMQAGCLQEMQAGHHVWYLDFESRYDEVTQRLLDLGGNWSSIRPFWHYSSPSEPLIVKDRWTRGGVDLGEALETLDLTFVVVDGVTEAMEIHGLAPTENDDYAKFKRMLLTRIADAGPCCATIDHVNKDPDTRRNQAMGAQHKRAGMTGATYSINVGASFSRTKPGYLKVVCAKDRKGYWDKGTTVAEAHAIPGTDGALAIEFRKPSKPDTKADDFRPTGLMEKVSRHLEVEPDGASTRAIRRDVKGKNEFIDKAIAALIREGHIDPSSHAVIRPYRQSDDPEVEDDAA